MVPVGSQDIENEYTSRSRSLIHTAVSSVAVPRRMCACRACWARQPLHCSTASEFRILNMLLQAIWQPLVVSGLTHTLGEASFWPALHPRKPS